MVAIFGFNGSGMQEREKNLYQGGGGLSKIRRGLGMTAIPYFHNKGDEEK